MKFILDPSVTTKTMTFVRYEPLLLRELCDVHLWFTASVRSADLDLSTSDLMSLFSLCRWTLSVTASITQLALTVSAVLISTMICPGDLQRKATHTPASVRTYLPMAFAHVFQLIKFVGQWQWSVFVVFLFYCPLKETRNNMVHLHQYFLS